MSEKEMPQSPESEEKMSAFIDQIEKIKNGPSGWPLSKVETKQLRDNELLDLWEEYKKYLADLSDSLSNPQLMKEKENEMAGISKTIAVRREAEKEPSKFDFLGWISNRFSILVSVAYEAKNGKEEDVEFGKEQLGSEMKIISGS